MKKLFNLTIIAATALILISCVTVKYQPVSVSQRQSFSNYNYVYVDADNSHGSYPNLVCNHIAGLLMKKGFVILNFNQYRSMSYSMARNTMIVTFGEGGTRSIGYGDYTREVTLHFMSATTKDLICVCTAEGKGPYHSDDVEAAVDRCIQRLFP